MTAPALWYVTRATGLSSLLLLTVVMVLGIATAGRAASTPPVHAFVAGLHRVAALMAVSFVGAHILTSVIDSYVNIGWLSAIVPFTSDYERAWVGLGTLAFDLLLALVATSLLRTRLGQRRWRAVHWAAFALWPVALLHGITAGTDLHGGRLLAASVTAALIVLATACWRWRRNQTGFPAETLKAAFDAGHRRASGSTATS